MSSIETKACEAITSRYPFLPVAAIEDLKARVSSETRFCTSSFAFSAFAPSQERLPLTTDEALVAVTTDALPAWELAARLDARAFVLVTPSRACLFDHLLTVGLFAITGGPSDFYARLVSRASALPGMPPQGALDLRLLTDTAHHTARAISDHVGHRLSEREKAIVIERLWRATHLARTPTYLAREEEHLRLQRLSRSQQAQAIWGDPLSAITTGELARTLGDFGRDAGCLALFDADALWARCYSEHTWQRVPKSAACRALMIARGASDTSDLQTLAALTQAPARQSSDAGSITHVLETSSTEDVLRLLEESLSQPIPELLPALFGFVHTRRAALEAAATEAGRALLSLCEASELHDDDPTWRAIASAMLEATGSEQVCHANALAYRLGLFI